MTSTIITLSLDGPAAEEFPSNILSNLIAIVRASFLEVIGMCGLVVIEMRFGQSRAR